MGWDNVAMMQNAEGETRLAIAAWIDERLADPKQDRVCFAPVDARIILDALRFVERPPRETTIAQRVEAIRKAKLAAVEVYGIDWRNLEDISQLELMLAALSTPSQEHRE